MRALIAGVLVSVAAASCASYAGYGCGSCVGCANDCYADGSCGQTCDYGYYAVQNGGYSPQSGVVDQNCNGYSVSDHVFINCFAAL